MDLIYKLKRKYGDTVEDIIAFGQQAREELEPHPISQERTEHLQAESIGSMYWPGIRPRC